MQNLFSHQFSQNIWRILPDTDPDSNLWAVELRDAETKKVSFGVVDLSRRELCWEGEPEATDWWTSLTAFSFRHLFLHNYRFPEIPEPTDLLMISGDNGQMQWVKPNYLLVKTLDREHIEAATKAGEKFRYYLCSAETGLNIQESEHINQSGEKIILGEPVRYQEGNPYFNRLAAYINANTLGHQALAIDYLEKRPYMMFSYYLYEQDKMAAYLLIMTSNSELIFHEKLSEGRDGIGQSTMFLKRENLVFLKNNNEFSSITL